MPFEYALVKRARCSNKEKEKLSPLLKLIVELHDIAIYDGLMAWEDKFQKIKHPFIRKGMELILDFTEPDMVREILFNSLMFGNLKGKDLLEGLIIVTALIETQTGTKLHVMIDQLNAYFGLDYPNDPFRQIIKKRHLKFLRKVKDKQVQSAATAMLEPIVRDLSKDDLRLIMGKFTSNELGYALAGASGETIVKMILALSYKYQVMLADELRGSSLEKAEGEVIKAQEKVKAVYEELKEKGALSERRLTQKKCYILDSCSTP